ncbi:MAG: hypothetical protein KDE56_00470 [Anaerolineales bacterium]|nr:hypothetical protein [Anaerolineales bacterium]
MTRFFMLTAICLSYLWLGSLALSPQPERQTADTGACAIVGTDIIFYCDYPQADAILIDDADMSDASFADPTLVVHSLSLPAPPNSIIGTDISF